MPSLLLPHCAFGRWRPILISCLLAAFGALLGTPKLAQAAEFHDLRNGARTTFFGSQGGDPVVGDIYGWAMAFGDVDGDGYDDFLSSSANADGPNDAHGPEKDVYLMFGRPRADFDSLYAIDQPGVADIVFYRGGFELACTDLDNDGYDDIVLAEQGLSVIFGRPRDQFLQVYNLKSDSPDFTPADIHVTGSFALGGAVVNVFGSLFDAVTRSLAVGDLNGDGYGDVAFGNYLACDPPGTCADGAAYILFGRQRSHFPALLHVDYATALPHPDVVFYGDTNEGYSTSLAIGDLDGDGIDDLLASASGWGESNEFPVVGEIHGWWGKHNWKSAYDTQLDSFDFAFQGTPGERGYALGYRMLMADLDGDGRDDLVLGSAYGYGDPLPDDLRNMGEYRILFGRPRTLWPKWAEAVDLTDVLILGAESGDALNLNGPQEWGICFSIAAGNRNGDKFDDLVIGAGQLRRQDDASRPGGAYCIDGKPRSRWQPLIDLRDEYDLVVYGADEAGSPGYQMDRTGYITAVGDIDGDKRDEIFIAAPFADGPSNSIPDCGEIYVVYDSETRATGGGDAPVAQRSALHPNFPNPFNASTTFGLSAPVGAVVSVTVYDARGRRVAEPLPPGRMQDGYQEINWLAVDEHGHALPSGLYFVKFRSNSESHARKVLLVR